MRQFTVRFRDKRNRKSKMFMEAESVAEAVTAVNYKLQQQGDKITAIINIKEWV